MISSSAYTGEPVATSAPGPASTPATPRAAGSASVASAPNSRVDASSRARESLSRSASPSARVMVETGTGTAPIRMAARYTTTNSGESAMSMSTRCSGCSPIPRRPAATRRTRSCSAA